jgi:hypothetical protein
MGCGAVVVCGREFSADLIERIAVAVRDHPEWRRAEVARQVCRWLNWRDGQGRLRVMSCRASLLRLQERGVLRLPATRRRVGARCRAPVSVRLETARIGPCLVDQLQRLELVAVRGRNQQARQWTELVRRDHPLHDARLCGAQLRYLIVSEHGIVGALGFSSAALHLKARDRWIGWTVEQRRAHRHRVVCNARFVIVPTVRVKNLASRVLAMAAARLPADWERAYGYRPVLLETYVECCRYRAVSYRAANWVQVGHTRGRGRQDRKHQRALSVKTVLLHPLQRDFRAVLCEPPGPARRLASGRRAAEPVGADWVGREFRSVRLRDRRLHQRLCTLVHDFNANPQANLPQACAGRRDKIKAAYRFFESEAVSMQRLLAAHYEQTAERVVQHGAKVVLAVQDSTGLNFTTHPTMEGIGPLSTSAQKALGLWMHDTMAYDRQGVALGLVDVQLWARDRRQLGRAQQRYDKPIEQKESVKWLTSFRAAARLQRQVGPAHMVVSVGDREADLYELFVLALSDPAHPKLLVRAERERTCEQGHQSIWEYLSGLAVSGEHVVQLPRRKGRPARTVRLEVRFAQVTLCPPKRKQRMGPVVLWAVYAREVGCPAVAKDAVEWMLWTTVEVSDFAQAVERLEWYTRRWGIEEYHRTLKSGCRIEDRRLAEAENWKKCLALDLVVAWRIEHLKRLSRRDPEGPSTAAFATDELQILLALNGCQPLDPDRPPSLRDAVRMMAQIGGFMGRKGDGEPGSITLWRGHESLQAMRIGWRLAHQQLFPNSTVSSHTDYG